MDASLITLLNGTGERLEHAGWDFLAVDVAVSNYLCYTLSFVLIHVAFSLVFLLDMSCFKLWLSIQTKAWI